MLNTDKIAKMTRASLYEEKQQRKELHTDTYFRVDYMTAHVMKVLVAVTVGFAAAAGMWFAYHMEEILTQRTPEQLVAMVQKGVLLYGAVLLVFLLISLFVYALRYRKERRGVKAYGETLKSIAREYSAEEEDDR
ncbi:MAG: hypothetical protein IJL66_01810 [Lachnospiraceae bacterium]|nr:hypothetical protein [Lachnospiraceae bacterium]